jgi:hypothetical protein
VAEINKIGGIGKIKTGRFTLVKIDQKATSQVFGDKGVSSNLSEDIDFVLKIKRRIGRLMTTQILNREKLE